MSKQTYTEMQTELEEIMQLLQSSEIDLDAIVPAYKRGMALVKKMESELENAQNVIEKIQLQATE